MFRRDICEKYQSRDEQFSLKTVFFSQIPLPNMIYLFNYTEYYLEHWLNNTFCLSFSGKLYFYCL